ncbi:MAG: CC/Se motif family (seleno)protein [Acidaminobacteraceae bacterium]
MKIIISSDAKEYLHSHKHNDIMLKLLHTDCCTGNINSRNPNISYHKPKRIDDFNMYEIDDFKFYIGKDVEAYDDTLEFVHEKLMGKNACHVKGLKLDNVTVM